MKLLFHPTTKKEVDRLIKQQPHAILLTGTEGAGKLTIARHIASSLLGENIAPGINTFEIVPNQKAVHTIESVREIKALLKLKVSGGNGHRVIIIQDAHLMQEAAQSALLKTLEEPPERTHIILTALSTQHLLPTIVSRTDTVSIRPLPLNAVGESVHGDEKKQQAFNLSGGNAGLFISLMDKESETEQTLLTAMQTAKKIIASNKYQRLLIADELQKDPEMLTKVIFCLQRILQYKLKLEPGKHISRRLKDCAIAESDIKSRVNKKLILTDLMLKI